MSVESQQQRQSPYGRRSLPDWWEPQVVPPVPDGYVEMIEQARRLLDALGAAVPDAGTVSDVTRGMRALTDLLAPSAVDEFGQLSGRIEDVPGRGQLLVPPAVIEYADDNRVECSVTFTRHFLGGNGAVHGGTLPLLFDDILGRFAQSGGRSVARTAYLHVDYRSITPVDKTLRLVGEFVSEEGRKRLVRATLMDGEALCAEAEGLFVVLRPGQP
jgi:acyl-coenzyme A thioesterase PaaI-like protein